MKSEVDKSRLDGYNRAEFHMRDPVYWDDAYPIALLLRETHPDVTDPASIEPATLREWVVALEAFADDRALMPIEWLEKILVEWVELR